MDYSYIRELTMLQARTTVQQMDAPYKLYYDETNNCKKFLMNNGRLNIDLLSRDVNKAFFVLGGIEGEGSITLDELKNAMSFRQKSAVEIKSHIVYNGDFHKALSSGRLYPILKLIHEKHWHIHFSSLNHLYWGVVDIIDSISHALHNTFDINETNVLKNSLYKIACNDFREMEALIERYQYPDIEDSEIKAFLRELLALTLKSIPNDDPYIDMLVKLFKEAVDKADNLLFVQDEESGVLLKDYVEFYKHPVYLFPNADITFDDEADISTLINEPQNEVLLNGREIHNYRFVNSKDNVMIQLSDIVVGLIARYMNFTESSEFEIHNAVNSYNDTQKQNFNLLNLMLRDSVNYNPAFFHFTSNLQQVENFQRCIMLTLK